MGSKITVEISMNFTECSVADVLRLFFRHSAVQVTFVLPRRAVYMNCYLLFTRGYLTTEAFARIRRWLVPHTYCYLSRIKFLRLFASVTCEERTRDAQLPLVNTALTVTCAHCSSVIVVVYIGQNCGSARRSHCWNMLVVTTQLVWCRFTKTASPEFFQDVKW